VDIFTLDRVTASSIEFDRKRLNWFNQQHMQRLSPEHLLELVVPRLLETYPNHEPLRDPEWAGALVDAVREQLETLDDALLATQFAFFDPQEYSPEALNELRSEAGNAVLIALRDALPAEGDLFLDTAEDLLRELRKEFRQTGNLNSLHVTPPVRAALTGTIEGPALPNIIALLGAETCRRRIDHALRQFTVSGD
jgi:glutamyl/glutaminyl-tRNA synthetase